METFAPFLPVHVSLCPVSNSSSSAMPKGQFHWKRGRTDAAVCMQCLLQHPTGHSVHRTPTIGATVVRSVHNQDFQRFLSPSLYLSTASWWRKARVNSLSVSVYRLVVAESKG